MDKRDGRCVTWGKLGNGMRHGLLRVNVYRQNKMFINGVKCR